MSDFLLFVQLLLYVLYLWISQPQQYMVIIINVYNWIYFKEADWRKKTKFVIIAFSILPFLVLLTCFCGFELLSSVISLDFPKW